MGGEGRVSVAFAGFMSVSGEKFGGQNYAMGGGYFGFKSWLGTVRSSSESSDVSCPSI